MVSSIAYKIQMETIFDKSSAKLCYLQHSIPNNFNFCSIIPIHYFMFLSRIGESLLWSIRRCPSPLMSRRGMFCSYASVYAIHPSAQRDEWTWGRCSYRMENMYRPWREITTVEGDPITTVEGDPDRRGRSRAWRDPAPRSGKGSWHLSHSCGNLDALPWKFLEIK